MHLGDFDTSAVIYGKFTTYRPSTGATFTLAGSPALSVYKDNSTTQSTTGVTLTADFDSVTGLNHFAIDTSADGTFYAAGSFFDIVITTGTVDSVSVTGSVVGRFTLRKNSALKPTTGGRTLDVTATGEAGIDWANIGGPTTTVNLSGTSTKALEPTTAGRTLDVTATGEAGIDWANIGAPTTVVGLSGTTVKTATDVETDTQDIQSRLPAALVSGRIDASVGAMAANTVTASAVAADAVTEIQAGLSTLDAAGVRTAVGLASANLDTQIAALATDATASAIKAKTDSLTFTVASVLDANVQRINDVTITGDGQVGTEFGV